MRAGQRKGYSLVEVLVVAAILTALMAVIVPAVINGRDGNSEISARASLSSTVDALVTHYSSASTFTGADSELARLASKVDIIAGNEESGAENQASVAAGADSAGVAIAAGNTCLYARVASAAPLVLYFVDDHAGTCAGERVVDLTPANDPATFADQPAAGGSTNRPVEL